MSGQDWFWTEEWQRAEKEAEADLDEGRFDDFDDVADMLADQEYHEFRKSLDDIMSESDAYIRCRIGQIALAELGLAVSPDYYPSHIKLVASDGTEYYPCQLTVLVRVEK